MLNRRTKTKEKSDLLSGKKWVGQKKTVIIAQKDEVPRIVQVTCVVDGCDNEGEERDRKG